MSCLDMKTQSIVAVVNAKIKTETNTKTKTRRKIKVKTKIMLTSFFVAQL